MKQITFATLGTPASINKTILLLESLRTFGGDYASSPVIVLIPAHVGVLPKEAIHGCPIWPVWG